MEIGVTGMGIPRGWKLYSVAGFLPGWKQLFWDSTPVGMEEYLICLVTYGTL